MALQEINKDAISFKRLSGKAHTQFGFDVTEEGLSSNIQIALTTVFGQQINPNPETSAGTTLGSTDGIVEKVRFEIDIIPDTVVGTNQSQGYRLKLPAGYSGALSAQYPAGTYLYEALGKLQIVPSLYGELKSDGSTEYDPVLFQTDGTTQIPKFDPINWNLDSYGGILFVQDPPTAYDTAPERPAFLEAYLYVGEYLDSAITGSSSTILNAGAGISPTQFVNDDTVAVDLESYTAPSNISITYTGSSNFVVADNSTDEHGIKYAANYHATYQPRSLVDKEYVDGIASGLSIRDAVQVASTGQIDLTSETVVDGITLEEGFRVLVKNQSDARQNGIYVYSTGTTNTLTRAEDFDTNQEAVSGAFTSVISGITNQATIWAVSTPDPISLNTTEIIWIRLALPITYIGLTGITVNGNNISVDGVSLAGIGINWNGSDGAFDLAFSATSVGIGESVFKDITTIGNDEVIRLRSIVGSGGTVVTTNGDTIIISGATGSDKTIGNPQPEEPLDNTYLDGLFPFTSGTSIGFAIDEINEFLLSLAPPFAPELDDIFTSNNSSFVNGELSFGVSNNDNGYTPVGTTAGGSAVDINGSFNTVNNGDRRGIINVAVSGILNEDVVDDGDGIPFVDGAFNNGDEGDLVLDLNGTTISTLDLTTNTTPLSNSNIAVSEIQFSRFSTGAEFTSAPYRTGTFSVLASDMRDGWNYMRITHSGTSAGDIVTNYLEWVYDPDTNNISGGVASINTNIILTGSREISGVEYNTGGSTDYIVVVSNVYKNVYSPSANAIAFPTTDNLSVNAGDGFEMDITGAGIVNSLAQTSFELPALDSGASNPADTDITINATMPIDSNKVLGSLGVLGRLRANISVDHPFSSKELNSASQATESGFLIYNIPDSSNNENEDFTGEVNRLVDDDYTAGGITYSNVNGNTYQWDNTQSLVGGDAEHNTGMLVFDGGLYYPNSSLLGSDYGINNGSFNAVTNAPAGNPDYQNASGGRTYFRKFKSNNTSSLASLNFEITHQGNASTFLTAGSNVIGSPSGNQIAFEFYVFRAGGDKYGYVNPFASFDNPFVIENSGVNHSGGVTSVSCSLVSKNVGNNDIIIVRMRFADGYSQKVTNVRITSI